jgi:hypothetical protein
MAAEDAGQRMHVRQHETCGPLFVPAYLIASVTAALRGRHFYVDNACEIAAYPGEANHVAEARQRTVTR